MGLVWTGRCSDFLNAGTSSIKAMEPWLSDLLIYSNYCLSFVFAIEMVVKLVGLGIRGYDIGD